MKFHENIDRIFSMVMEKRVGFLADEIMSGFHRFTQIPNSKRKKYPFEFRVTWGSRHITDFFNPLHPQFMRTALEGNISVGGLVQNAKCVGFLELRYIPDGEIRYNFKFHADGKDYQFVGEKRKIRPWNLHRTHTICYGKLIEVTTREVISESITYFKLWRLPSFLLSFRLG